MQKLTILYARLSKDDMLTGDSNSIVNQKAMLERYATENGLIPYLTLQDDGFSGTNFDRPGWQELIQRIENGEVSTLCCKDGTRLGRNYLQMGLYREMFREKGVRLVCLNDGTDTALGEDDFTPFREIMAEWYARDTSKKIKSVLSAKGRDGKPLANVPPYGFIKDPEDKNRWLIDSEAAAVVRRIYQMTIDGHGPYEIAHILHDEGIERPSYYQTKKGIGNHQSDCDLDNPCGWRGNTVAVMISHPEYAGHTANFKTVKPSFKSKKSKKVAQENWQIFENTHPAIVDQSTWDLAQKLRETVRRTDTTGEANPLTGLLFCGECGARMYNKRCANRTMRTNYLSGNSYLRTAADSYSCSAHSLARQTYKEVCSEHYISTAAVREIILDVLRRTSGYVREHEVEFAERIRESSALQQGETVKSHKKAIAKNERRVAELDKLFWNVYEDKVKGVLSEERFAQMSAKYEQEQAETKAQLETLQSELDDYNANVESADKFIELVRRFTSFEELTTAMINELVERIDVHEGEWSEADPVTGYKGTRSQQVDVYLKYIGKFDTPNIRTAEELEAERIAEEKLIKKRECNRRYMRRKYAEVRASKAEAI
jgi:DNA invertase Pin-like site-specific DNA recombinase